MNSLRYDKMTPKFAKVGLDLPPNTTREDLLKAMDGHVVGKSAWFGRFHTPAPLEEFFSATKFAAMRRQAIGAAWGLAHRRRTPELPGTTSAPNRRLTTIQPDAISRNCKRAKGC